MAALRGHLSGSKHLQAVETPPDNSDFQIVNGKWRKRAGGVKRPHEESSKPSKRERTKVNKVARNIPILAQHTEAKYEETETYFQDGLRRVRPYYFTFTTHAKGRWVGETLSEVFAREFRALEPAEFGRCVEEGLVRVNNTTSRLDYRIENNDFISHTVHRHELPVTGQKITVIHEDEDWVVVDKPPSIPVHPCGRYRHNSVIFILAKELGFKHLHTVHRLDRLTSGVLIFSKTSGKARVMEQLIKAREVEKEYLCRVTGQFPEEEIVCEEPLETISYKIGVVIVHPQGKPSKTTFQRVSYKDGVSIVRCRPKSGRMHQIRVHLQYLGFPIANDPLYNSQIFGPEKGKGGVTGKTREELIEDLIKLHTVENWVETEEYQASKLDIAGTAGTTLDLIPSNPETKEAGEQDVAFKASSDEVHEASLDGKEYYDPHCSECKTSYKDPPPETLLIFLHALKYSGEGWSYETAPPAWANL